MLYLNIEKGGDIMLLTALSFVVEFTKTLIIDTIITAILRPVEIIKNDFIKPYYILG